MRKVNMIQSKIQQLKFFYDDLNLATKQSHNDYETHLADLDKLLKRIYRTGLKISLDKCSFATNLEKDTVKCLGFYIGNGKITLDPKKLEAIRNLGLPKPLKHLQTLCGCLQYIRHLLPLGTGSLLTLLNNYASEKKFIPMKISRKYIMN